MRRGPASYVAFDVLAVAGQYVRDLPWRDLRALLEELTRTWEPPLQLSPVTTDLQEASRWLEDRP